MVKLNNLGADLFKENKYHYAPTGYINNNLEFLEDLLRLDKKLKNRQ